MIDRTKIYMHFNRLTCEIRHDYMPLYYMLLNFQDKISFNANLKPKWMEEIDVKYEFNSSYDVLFTDYIDDFVINSLKSKKFNVFAINDPTDNDLASDFVIENFDIVMKYQCNKKYINYKNIFVPPYPLSGGLIPKLTPIKHTSEKQKSIFFLGGISDLNDINNIRIRKARDLKKFFGDKFYGGITTSGFDISFPAVSQNDFYKIIEDSKICVSINQRELQRGLDRRMSEIMLYNSCIVTHPFNVLLHKVPVNFSEIVYTDDNMNSLCDIINMLLKEEDKIDYIASNGRKFLLDCYTNQGEWFYNIIMKLMR